MSRVRSTSRASDPGKREALASRGLELADGGDDLAVAGDGFEHGRSRRMTLRRPGLTQNLEQRGGISLGGELTRQIAQAIAVFRRHVLNRRR